MSTGASSDATGREIAFGPFRLQPERQLLLEGDRPVRIGGRALDILLVLVERAGELVTKEELISRVWPNVVVEEGNLRTQMALLRRALNEGRGGARYVAAVAGRGYRFVAPVSVVAGAAPAPDPKPLRPRLPTPSSRVVGREDVVQVLSNRLQQGRFVTIVGPGGIGKTTVAATTGHALSAAFEAQVTFIDLGPLADPRLVPGTVASSLGLTVSAADPIGDLVAALRDRRLLLIFDCCEHVIESMAILTERLFIEAPAVHMLATSREPLRVEGEHIYRLFPLPCPPAGKGLSASDLLGFPAAQLFVERATASHGFALTDADAPAVAGICHRLDGIPLALELAAAGVDAFGVSGLAAQLDRHILLTTRGRRTAMPRHQTLRATIDWSYELLSEAERSLLCRLGTFAGAFTLEAASAVAEDSSLTKVGALELLAGLAAKSLVAFDGAEPPGRWRLLETIRAYALQKLDERGEAQEARRCHAEYFRGLFAAHASETSRPIAPEDLAPLVRELDDVRAALDWSFAPTGDVAIGIDLTSVFAQAWLHSSLVVECRERCERALLYCPADRKSHVAQRLQLLTGLGAALLVTMSSSDQNVVVLTEALELAERLNQLDTQARILWGLCTLLTRRGERRASHNMAERFVSVAQQTGDPGTLAVANRIMGNEILQITGRPRDAQEYYERVVRLTASSTDQRQTVWSLSENRATARAALSMTLALQGLADRARAEAKTSVEELQSDVLLISSCRVLTYGMCRVSLLTGDLAGAEAAIGRLIDLATRSNALIWQIEGQFLYAQLMNERNEFERGLAAVRDAIETSRRVGWHATNAEFDCTHTAALVGTGRFEDALNVIDDALAMATNTEDVQSVYLSELHRLKGATLLGRAADRNALPAEECFRRAGEIAHRQGVLLFELRAARDLARLHLTHGRRTEATETLAPVYERFTESFEVPEIREARTLLALLDSARGVS